MEGPRNLISNNQSVQNENKLPESKEESKKCVLGHREVNKSPSGDNPSQRLDSIKNIASETIEDEVKPAVITHKAKGVLPEFQNKDEDNLKIKNMAIGNELGAGSNGGIYEAKIINDDSINNKNTQWQKSYVFKLQDDEEDYICSRDSIPPEYQDFSSKINEATLQRTNPGAPKIIDAGIFPHIDEEKQKKGIKMYAMVMERKMATLDNLIPKKSDAQDVYTKSESLNKSIIMQLAKQIATNHNNNIVHKDIKPANIMLDHRGEVFLCDYGMSEKVEDESEILPEGTPYYMAPEIMDRISDNPTYQISLSGKIDSWSLGATVYELFTGKTFSAFNINSSCFTFNKKKYNALMKGIRKNKFLPEEAKSLLNDLLQIDPGKRLSMKRVAEHPFLNTYELSYARLQHEHSDAYEQLVKNEKELDDINNALDEISQGIEPKSTMVELNKRKEDVLKVIGVLGKTVTDLQKDMALLDSKK